jgi:hypothetical protein
MLWPQRPSSVDQLLFSKAVAAVQYELEDGGNAKVSEVIEALAGKRPARDRQRVIRAVLSSLLVIGIFRRLRPNERMQFNVGRICAVTKL